MLRKKAFVLVICLTCLLFFELGCIAQKKKRPKPPDFAVTNLEDSVTAPHPDQLKKEGDSIVIFPLIFPAELMLECTRVGWGGTWKVIAVDQRDPSLEIQIGFAYFKQTDGYPQNPWGTPLLEGVFIGKLEDLKYYKFILANRDGMVWLFSPMAKTFSSEDTGEERVIYSSRRLEEDINYRRWVFSEYGMNLWQISQAFSVSGIQEKISIGEIRIGSEDWKSFEKDFIISLPESYEMGNGKIVSSSSQIGEVQRLVKINPRLNGWQRFMDVLNVPISTPEMMALSGISQVINFAYHEKMSGPKFRSNSAISIPPERRYLLAKKFKFLIESQNRKQMIDFIIYRKPEGGEK